MKPTVALRKALANPLLLGRSIAGDSREVWRTLLIAAMGEELTADERAIFKQFTGGRECEPGQMVEEFVAVVGRRGGKSSAIAALATYTAGVCEHPALVAGERGVLLIFAADQKQADIVLDYIEATFEGSPILKQLVKSRTARELRLTNRIDIEVRAADFRRLRGPTYIAVIADEVAFFMNENSVNPDSEILNAVRPGLATTGGPLFMISSPYARRGELWRTYSKHFGAAGDPLI
jgi:phage terminase large subunit-like protein